jgi:hypothetical protein
MPLVRYPGALADLHGYVVFENEEELKKCPGVTYRGIGTRNLRLGVPQGISRLPGYIRKRR